MDRRAPVRGAGAMAGLGAVVGVAMIGLFATSVRAAWSGLEANPDRRDAQRSVASNPDEDAARQRLAELAADDARAWQQAHGDLVVPWEDAHGHLAIMIDDCGRELELQGRLSELRYPLSFSVLPGAIYAEGTQLRLSEDRRRPREIWLHLPMQPRAGEPRERVDEQAEEFLLVEDSPLELRGKIGRAFAKVPRAVGVNNHMGSLLTADCDAMDVVMEELAARERLFVDSRTTPDTCAETRAKAHGVPVARRDVFLDHDPSEEAIRAALKDAAERSRSAPILAIGHPSPQLVRVLEAELPRLHAEGIGLYPASAIVRAREGAH